MHFNYFLPGRRAVKLENLVELGLGYAFEPESAADPRATFTPRPVTNGPGGQHGIIVSASDEWVGYFQGKQAWKQEPGKEYWVGYWKDTPPTPETLARANQIDGRMLRLEDGNAWLIPVARQYDEFDGVIMARQMLPTRLTRDELGNWVHGDIKQRYRLFWDLTNAFIQAIVDDQQQFHDYDDLVVEAFKCNYRVSAIELDMLGIYDATVRDRVIRIVTDLDGYRDLVKKKQALLDSGGSLVGPNESKPAEEMGTTGQP